MAYTKASGKAVDKYCKKVYDQIPLRVKKGEKDVIKVHAESKGLSVNAYINQLIEKDMSASEEERDSKA